MIEVHSLCKKYGAFTAVDSLSFTVEQGEVLGFLGPNGAGKSTTMKMLTCFLPPTSGHAHIGGKSILSDSLAVRTQMGYLPESAPSYAEMRVEEFLRFIGAVRGLSAAQRDKHVDLVVERTGLEDVRSQVIDTLSKGYRQRTCFAQALLHDPPVLILDEPTDGLDPNQKHEVRLLIRRMGAEKKTIILSTHILEEMESVCTRALIIANGRLVANGSPDQLVAQSPWHNAVSLTLAKASAAVLKKFEKIDGVASVESNPKKPNSPVQLRLMAKNQQNIAPEVSRFLQENKLVALEMYVERGRMDEVFRKVTLPAS